MFLIKLFLTPLKKSPFKSCPSDNYMVLFVGLNTSVQGLKKSYLTKNYWSLFLLINWTRKNALWKMPTKLLQRWLGLIAYHYIWSIIWLFGKLISNFCIFIMCLIWYNVDCARRWRLIRIRYMRKFWVKVSNPVWKKRWKL